MKINEVRYELLYDKTIIKIEVPNIYRSQIIDIFSGIDSEANYILSLKKQRQGRSLDANAYAWVLIGKLAEKLNLGVIEVYRNIIQDFTSYIIVPVREDLTDKWKYIWSSKGVGWLTEDLGECRTIEGFRYMKSHYGSSTFDTKEMSQFIDLIIEECKAQGIEHLPPEEINKLKQEWK